MPDAIAGQSGHGATLARLASVIGLDYPTIKAMSAIQRFNATKTGGEPWTDAS